MACWETLAPYENVDGDWDALQVDYAKQILEKWSEYAPNLANATVIREYVNHPKHIEAKLPEHEARARSSTAPINPTQMLSNRPNADCSSYRTPIENLYVCGASVWPGGMVLLGGGYNVCGRGGRRPRARALVVRTRIHRRKHARRGWWADAVLVERTRQEDDPALSLRRGSRSRAEITLYLSRARWRRPSLWEYIMPMKGEDIEDFLALLKDPALTDFIYRSPQRWKIVGTMMWGGVELLGMVVVAALRQALGQIPAEENVVIEVPPPSVRKKKSKKRATRRRLGSKTIVAPSAAAKKDDEEKAASAGG